MMHMMHVLHLMQLTHQKLQACETVLRSPTYWTHLESLTKGLAILTNYGTAVKTRCQSKPTSQLSEVHSRRCYVATNNGSVLNSNPSSALPL